MTQGTEEETSEKQSKTESSGETARQDKKEKTFKQTLPRLSIIGIKILTKVCVGGRLKVKWQ